MLRTLLWLGLLAALGAGLYVYYESNRPLATVKVRQVRTGDLVTTFVSTGLVEAREVQLAPEVPGRIVRLAAREGDTVRPGQLLVMLDTRDAQARLNQARELLAAANTRRMEAQYALSLQNSQTAATVRQAEAQLGAARAALLKLQNGATTEEIQQARLRRQEAQTSLRFARTSEQRARQLYEDGFVSRAALDEATTQRQLSEARLQTADAVLRQVLRGAREEDRRAAEEQVRTSQAQLQLAQSNEQRLPMLEAQLQAADAGYRQQRAVVDAAMADLEKHTVRAPSAGIVARKLVEEGETAAPGRPILTLMQPSDVWVRAEVAEEDIGLVTLQQTLKVTAPAYQGTVFKGRVEEIAPRVEQKPDSAVRSRILRVKVRLDPPGPSMLRPGMETTVEGSKALARDMLLVPREALVRKGAEVVVWVADNGVCRRRVVRLGPQNFEYAAVQDGLKAGEWVIVSSLDLLKDAGRIEIAPAQP